MAELPDWQPLDGAIPKPDAAGAGRIVALVASEGAVDAGWAAAAALQVARACSGAGDKVILVDGGLHNPTLHAHASIDNGEGLSDAALFGVSVGRVARPVDDGAFFLITAGTAVADANAVVASPRWGRLLEGFLEAGVTLLLFVRDGDSGSAAFLGSASQIVVLAGRHEDAPRAVRDLEGLVQAVTGPQDGGRESGAGSPAGASASVRPPQAWTSAGPGSRTRLSLLVLVVVLLIVVLAAVFGLIDVPGITPGPAEPIGGTSPDGALPALA